MRADEMLARDLAAGRARRDRVPVGLRAGRNWSEDRVDGHIVHRFGPRGRPPSDITYVHLHGGGFVTGLLALQMRALARVADLSGARVVLPDYPLPPRHDAEAILRFCDALLDEAPGPLVLGGDSAGGTLAILLCQRRAAARRPLPRRLMLWSPLCDLAVTTPGGARDAVIEPVGVRAGAARFAEPAGVDSPAVNPARGEPVGLPPTTLICGDRDPLWPDAEVWSARARTEGVSVTTHRHEGLGHYWMFLPQAEARVALRQVAEAVTSTP